MDHSIKLTDLDRLAQYADTLRIRPRLMYLFFELTDACNLSCLHCGSSASPHNRQYLPFEDIQPVLDSVAAKYPPQSIMVCLSGGEPLLHPDFFKIAAYATKLGFSCGITTNGTLIDQHTALRIVESGIGSVTFSIDGTRDTHDWFRCQKGAFTKAITGIQNLISVSGDRISTQITSVIHKKNIHQLDALFSLSQALQVDSLRLVNLEPIGRAKLQPDLLLDASEYRQLLDYIYHKRITEQVDLDVTFGCSHYLPTEYEHMVRDNYFLCGSGIYVASILCNGDIYSCMDIQRRPELVQGNIRQDDFVDVWENRFREFREDRTHQCQTCLDCPEKRYCRGDSAHTWDYDNQRPMICLRQLLKPKGE